MARLTNSEETYGLIHQLLHWTVAGLILFMIPLGAYMHELPQGTQEQINDKVWLYSLHKTVGIAALLVALLRILWAVLQPHPRLLNGGLEAIGAKTIHILLYVMIIAVPVFGWLHHAAETGYAPIWFWGIGDTLPFIPKDEGLAHFFKVAHWLSVVGLVLSLFLHIGGAIKHAIFDKDRTLQRMVPGAYLETGLLPEKVDTGRSPTLLAMAALALGVVAIMGVHFGPSFVGSQASTEVALEDASAQADFEPNWRVAMERSSLTVDIMQLGSPVSGRFERFSAAVLFDPEAPEKAKIEVEVPVASFQFGSNTEQALSGDFLNVKDYPTARFTALSVKRAGNGFEAVGELALAGTTQPVVVTFTFEEEGGEARVVGMTELARLDFGVGAAYGDDATVGRMVTVRFELFAVRK